MLRAFSSSDEFLQYLAGVRRADRGTDYSVSDLVSILVCINPGVNHSRLMWSGTAVSVLRLTTVSTDSSIVLTSDDRLMISGL